MKVAFGKRTKAFLRGFIVGGVFAVGGCNDSDAVVGPQAPGFVWAIGNRDLLEGQLDTPRTLALEPATGHVYVYDNRYVHVFSGDGTFLNRWVAPARMADMSFDRDGTILMTKEEDGIVFRLSPEGTVLHSWGGPGQLNNPQGVSGSGKGWVYVADRDNHRILVFDSSGTFVKTWGVQGNGAGEFDRPFDIAVDASNRVYVWDSGNYRIQTFDSEGNWLNQWGLLGVGPGEFRSNVALAAVPSGGVFSLEDGIRVQRFSAEGEFLDEWRGEGTWFYNMPSQGFGIALDPSERVYTLGLAGFGIQVYDETGLLLDAFGTPRGQGPAQFIGPVSVVVAEDGSVVVGQSTFGRIQRLNSDGQFLNDWVSIEGGEELQDLAGGPGATVFTLKYNPLINESTVQQFALTGQPLVEWTTFAAAQGLDIDEQGQIWLLRGQDHRIEVYSLNGERLLAWGEPGLDPGELWWPNSMAVGNGSVVVCDAKSIAVFDPQGTFLRNLGAWDPENFDARYVAVDMDAAGSVYAVSRTKLSIFHLDGGPPGTFGPIDSSGPRDVAAGEGGEVYCLTSSVPNLWKFDIE